MSVLLSIHSNDSPLIGVGGPDGEVSAGPAVDIAITPLNCSSENRIRLFITRELDSAGAAIRTRSLKDRRGGGHRVISSFGNIVERSLHFRVMTPWGTNDF